MRRWRRRTVDVHLAIARLIIVSELAYGRASKARIIAVARTVLKLRVCNTRAYKVSPVARRSRALEKPAPTLVREAYRAVELIFGTGSVYRARRIARALGAVFTDADATRWLSKFREFKGKLFDRCANLRQFRWLAPLLAPARVWPSVRVDGPRVAARRRGPPRP